MKWGRGFKSLIWCVKGFPCGSGGKESACNVVDLGSISSREDPLEKAVATHSSVCCLENPMDRGAW